MSFGPAGLGLAANFRQLITVLGVLAGAGIFNGVTKYVAQYHDNPQQLRRVVGTSSAMVLGFSARTPIKLPTISDNALPADVYKRQGFMSHRFID